MMHVMILAANAPGMLRRLIGLLDSRGYRVESFAVGPCETTGRLRISLTLDETRERAELLARQLRRLFDVTTVGVAVENELVRRELALIKVSVGPGKRPEVLQVANVFRANVIDVAPESIVVEATGDKSKIDALIALLHEFGIAEIARSGTITLHRGGQALSATSRDPIVDAGIDHVAKTVMAAQPAQDATDQT